MSTAQRGDRLQRGPSQRRPGDDARGGARQRRRPPGRLNQYRNHRNIIPLTGTRDNSATSNIMKLVHWPLMGGLLHLVQRGGDWAELQPVRFPPRCTKCNNPPINDHCTNHRIVGLRFQCAIKGLISSTN